MTSNQQQVQCMICGGASNLHFNAQVLNKHDVNYYHCEDCLFLQTEKPFWLDEAYSESMNLSDTGIMVRNINLSQITTLIVYFFYDKKKSFLDFAGGYGALTRMLRDIGFDFYWMDKFSNNLLARGFEHNSINQYELVTAFEAFEHFEYPLKEIERILELTDSILFSTDLTSEVIPKPTEWWYYGLDHGQHIAFFNKKTLEYIAKKYQLNLYTNNSSVHLLTRKEINKYFFWFVMKLNRLGIFYFIRFFLSSKTGTDMSEIISKLNTK